MRRTYRLCGLSVIVLAVLAGCKPPPTSPAAADVQAREPDEEANRLTRQRMQAIMQSIEFSGFKFKDVVQFLRDVGNVSIYVDWGAVQAAGIDDAAPVNVKLINVTFEKALKTVLEDVSGGQVDLRYVVAEGVITISTKEDLDTNTITKVYAVRDLVGKGELSDRQKELLLDAMVEALRRPVGESAGERFPNNSARPAQEAGPSFAEVYQRRIHDLTEALADTLEARRARQLIAVIQAAVELDSWIDEGGTVGAAKYFKGTLTVTQTHDAHRKIAALLATLRERMGGDQDRSRERP